MQPAAPTPPHLTSWTEFYVKDLWLQTATTDWTCHWRRKMMAQRAARSQMKVSQMLATLQYANVVLSWGFYFSLLAEAGTFISRLMVLLEKKIMLPFLLLSAATFVFVFHREGNQRTRRREIHSIRTQRFDFYHKQVNNHNCQIHS